MPKGTLVVLDGGMGRLKRYGQAEIALHDTLMVASGMKDATHKALDT